MPKARARDRGSIALYGSHGALLLVDPGAVDRLRLALEPSPCRTRFRPPEDGDPFEDRSRPLYLSVASDCSTLPPATYRALIALNHLPGVRVDLMPGLPIPEDATVGIVGWDGSGGGMSARTTRSRDRSGLMWLSEDWLGLAGWILKADDETGRRLVTEAKAHEALGYDYIVSQTLASSQFRGGGRWPDGIGVCTPIEAFRLAGTKSRMYGAVPVDPVEFHTSTSAGRLYDQAVTHYVPHLARAIRSSLAVTHDGRDGPELQYLLAIRSRLNELLIARDEVYRLTRRESADPRMGWPKKEAKSPGRTGNDLTVLLAYNTSAALNAAFAAGDALAWTAAARDGAAANNRSVGLARLFEGKEGWAAGATPTALRESLMRSRATPFTQAARVLRNAMVHRDAIEYGGVIVKAGSPKQLSALWVVESDLNKECPWTLSGDPLFDVVSGTSDYSDGEMAVVTFQRLVDRLWCSTAATIADGLKNLGWSTAAWFRSSEAFRRQRRADSLWKHHVQRRLWGW